VYLGTRRRAVATVLNRALRAAGGKYRAGALDRETILAAARAVAAATLGEQMLMTPSQRVVFEVDYISLADPESMLEIDYVDPVKGAILSGAVKMLRVEDPQAGEDTGHSDGPVVRLIDNIILPPQ
jgi:pantoate--beta-alanine ligase